MLEMLKALKSKEIDVKLMLDLISSDFYDVLELLNSKDKDFDFLYDFCEQNCKDFKRNQMNDLANILYAKLS